MCSTPTAKHRFAELRLIKPSLEALPGFVDALQRGWSRDNIDGAKTARADLERIAVDPAAFVASLDDVEAKGGPLTLPDGSKVERMPGYNRWIWDGEFAGSVGFRWRPGTSQLPAHTLGHMGYAVVPWKRGQGYASRALALLLPDARAMGLPYVDLITEPDNIPSQKVILNNGGELTEEFEPPPAYGEGVKFRYRVTL